MGLFSKPKPNPADEAAELRGSAKANKTVSAAARKAGLDGVADKTRRAAATQRVVARYAETGRCQYGHRNCTDGGH